jgi:hypothetical protein
MTGTYDNTGAGTGCITFTNSNGIKIEGTGGTSGFNLNGKICTHM